MKLLLDTHAFLWFVGADERLGARARRRIEDGRNESFLSTASVWEMAIKIGLGKLRLREPLGDSLDHGARDNGIRVLDVTRKHALAIVDLPLHHADPFDRMLVAQAGLEGMAIVSRDPVFDAYAIRRIW